MSGFDPLRTFRDASFALEAEIGRKIEQSQEQTPAQAYSIGSRRGREPSGKATSMRATSASVN